MADFNGKKGHWVTTDSGSHVFIESGKSFDEAVSDAFGKENKGKYKKDNDFESLNDTVTDENIMEEISDNDYYYGNLDEQSIYNLAAERLNKKYDANLTSDQVKTALKNQGFNFEEYQKYLDEDDFDNDNDFENWGEEDSDNKPYDFDKWAKNTNSKKENHIAYIDTNKKYDANSIFDIITNDEGWQTQGTMGNKVLFSHESGPTYVFDKNTGKVELTTRELENKKGKEAHTKELTDYVKNAIKNGITDPETIYQNSPYSIHSHDEIVDLANKYNKKAFGKKE